MKAVGECHGAGGDRESSCAAPRGVCGAITVGGVGPRGGGTRGRHAGARRVGRGRQGAVESWARVWHGPWSAISAAVVGVVGGSEGSEGTKWLGAGSRRRGARPRALPSRSAGLLSYSGSRCMSQCYSGLLSTPFREVTCSSQLSSPFSRPAAMHAGPERASARPASFGRHGCTGTLHGLGPGERPK